MYFIFKLLYDKIHRAGFVATDSRDMRSSTNIREAAQHYNT